jgi:hypothetical protein
MKRFEFVVTLSGEGEDEEDAWFDALEAFEQDPGEPETVREVENDDEG